MTRKAGQWEEEEVAQSHEEEGDASPPGREDVDLLKTSYSSDWFDEIMCHVPSHPQFYSVQPHECGKKKAKLKRVKYRCHAPYKSYEETDRQDKGKKEEREEKYKI
ncbi:hypothetical protein STEG23_027144 [Scotinomys teguina]